LPHGQGCGRLLALDEAHKYMDGAVTDGLSAAIVNIARQMRHDGIRLVVGTQSPRALAPELLELVTVAVIHRFHSKDWFSYLKVKIPLENAAWDRILDLKPGEALVFASRHQIGVREREVSEGIAENDGGGDETDTFLLDTNSNAQSCSDVMQTSFPFGRNIFEMKIRSRLTADVGRSSVNKQSRNFKK
jgi:hypothetical protein